MVSTRSAAKQTHIEDFTDSQTTNKAKDAKSAKNTMKPSVDKPASPKKRKEPATDAAKSPKPAKKSKASDSGDKDTHAADAPDSKEKDEDEDKPIIINRAPVLHLFAACVTQTLYSDLKWSTCLSAGSAVSAICAISKGRSIGTVPESDPSKESSKQKRRGGEQDLDEIQVMQFHLKLKDSKALVSGKPSSDVEVTLKGKFRGRYEEVKGVFDDALGAWKNDHDGLNEEGFGMYESFRPTVAKGQKGWGRAAELDLGHVRSAISKS